MEPIGFVCYSTELPFYLPVIEQLPKDLAHILLAEDCELPPDLNVRKLPCFATRGLARALDLGYAVHPANNAFLRRYRQVACSAGVFHSYSWIDERLFSAWQAAYLMHAVDASCVPHPTCRWAIAQHARMLQAPEPGKVLRGDMPEDFAALRARPRETVTEYAVTGPHHLGE